MAKIETASGCRGISSYKAGKHAVLPVPEEFKNLYVPRPWQEQLLPVGAYKSLWPNSQGNDWVKVKPENFGPGWRPQKLG
jgi:hypothetical protein